MSLVVRGPVVDGSRMLLMKFDGRETNDLIRLVRGSSEFRRRAVESEEYEVLQDLAMTIPGGKAYWWKGYLVEINYN